MNRQRSYAAVGIVLVLGSIVSIPLVGALDSLLGVLGVITDLIDASYLASALRLTVPIGFAAIGGIFAEKSGVINIGLEGLLIIAGFSGVAVAGWLGGDTQFAVWVGFFAAILASTAFAWLFAVVTIRFKANQIIAGLAVWLVALGLAPFLGNVLWGKRSYYEVANLKKWTVPILADLPFIGPAVFDANPTIYMLLVAAPGTWYVINRTSFGRWLRASGENPKALDTAGVNVKRVRYAGVLLSGFFCGIGGAGLSLAQFGGFNGSGATTVNGRGWIGITAYLFGNYNPLGAFGASFLFASLDALQFRLQQIGAGIPPSLVQMVPYVSVIVVLALVGHTRLPEAAGEHYESGED